MTDNWFTRVYQIVIIGFLLGTAAFVDYKVTPTLKTLAETYTQASQTQETIRRIQTYLLVRQTPALRGCTTWDDEDWQTFQEKMETHWWKHLDTRGCNER